MLRRNSGKGGLAQGVTNSPNSARRPGTLRGLNSMVRRTLGETDLRSLRQSFSSMTSGLLRRGSGSQPGDDQAGEQGASDARDGAVGHATPDGAAQSQSSPSASTTDCDHSQEGGSSQPDPGSLPLPPQGKEEGGVASTSRDSRKEGLQADSADSQQKRLSFAPERADGERQKRTSSKGWPRFDDGDAGGTSSDDDMKRRRKSSSWSAGVVDGSLSAMLDEAEQKMKAAGDEMTGGETLSRNHPIFELLRMRKAEAQAQARALEGKETGIRHVSHGADDAAALAVNAAISPKAPTAKDAEQLKLLDGAPGMMRQARVCDAETGATAAGIEEPGVEGVGTDQDKQIDKSRYMEDYYYGYVDRLVLKFTTYSQSNEVSSYLIDKNGGTFGRESSNTVSVPSDTTLEGVGHALITFKDGFFYLKNQGETHCAAVRIGVGTGLRDWPLPLESAFSAGNSIFVVKELTDGLLVADIIDGPLKGERRKVNKAGATLGRSPDNILSIADPELSRRHSKIEYEDSDGKYYLCDVGSTNGTYMQLVGPYAGTFKLTLSDQIMVGRTGFSINRFDYGISEEKGRRKTMEDHTLVIQDLGVRSLKRYGLAPQTFAAVFDGHGGEHASAYLCTHIQGNLSRALEDQFSHLTKTRGPGAAQPSMEELDKLVEEAVIRAFMKTDEDFLSKSDHPEAGSTGTTVLIMGNRVYMCNVGDSRTIMSRNGQVHVSSRDHKPGREDESKRIREAGGFIFQNRVMGELAVSRAFGDKELKKSMRDIMGPDELQQMSLRDAKSDGDLVKDYSQPLLIARPETIVTELTSEDQFILLACDGLFDVFNNQEVVDFILNEMRTHHDAQRTCENLSHTAIHKRMASDNVSICLLLLSERL